MEKIKLTNNHGIEKEYDVIFEFTSRNDNKNYIVYTDYQKDKDNNLIVYSSIYENNMLHPVTGKEELAYIDSMLESIENKAHTKYKIEEN